MKVVITGGAGFIGQNLARALIRRGVLTGPSGAEEEIDSIVLFDAVAPPALPPDPGGRITAVTGDIAGRQAVAAVIDEILDRPEHRWQSAARKPKGHASADPSGEGDAQPPGGARVAVRGVSASLLVAYEDVADLRVRRYAVVEGEDDAAGIPEDRVHPDALQALKDDIRAFELHGWSRFLLSVLRCAPGRDSLYRTAARFVRAVRGEPPDTRAGRLLHKVQRRLAEYED